MLQECVSREQAIFDQGRARGMLAAPRLPLLSSSYRPPLRTHTHSLQQGLSRCLGRAAGMPPLGLGRVGWMEFSPGEVEEAKRRYIYPLKASCALWFWLWLRDGCGSGFRSLRARHPHSSIRLIKVRGVWVRVSGQILASFVSTKPL